MGGVTRANISMISARQRGTVISEGVHLSVRDEGSGNIATEFSGYFDRLTGTLTLSIPNQPKIQIAGFLTESSIPSSSGTSIKGDRGRDGVDGIVGLEGRRGQQGCIGPEGERGATGIPGPRGKIGPTGVTGATGATGERGEDGKVLIFTQADDPGPVGAFAIWVKPTN